MKKLAYILIGIGIASFLHLATVRAAPTSTIVKNLFITGLSSAGNPCLIIGSNGFVSTSTSCGTGGGSTTLIYAGSYIGVTASGTDGYIISNTGVTSTLGNWVGTWQGVNSTTFYLASNPSHYVATSSLGTAALYAFGDFLPSSTVFIANNTGNWAGTWQGVNSTTFYLASNPSHYVATSSLGTAALFNSSDFLASTTNYVPQTTQVNSGGILTGGGALSGNQTISLTTSTLNTNVSALGYVTSSASGVTSLNSITGATIIAAGSGISVASTSQTITITASASASGTINNAATNQVAYYSATSTISGTSTLTFVPGGGSASSTNLVLGTSTSAGCVETIDQTNSSTYYYSYWNGGQPFWDTSSCVK